MQREIGGRGGQTTDAGKPQCSLDSWFMTSGTAKEWVKRILFSQWC
jgi:hypothetical protein